MSSNFGDVLRKIHDINHLIACPIGILANCLLVYLIVFKTDRELKVYRRILIQNCIFDILWDVINLIIRVVSVERILKFWEGRIFGKE